MARRPQITRTIITSVCNVMFANVETQQTENREVTLPRTYKDAPAILKALRPMYAGTALVPVHVLGVEVKETLYGMDETDFIKAAKVLPSRTKSDTENEEEVED